MPNGKRSFRILVLFFISLLFLPSSNSFSQSKIRIGIYDSRAVAVAWFQSDYRNSFLKKMDDLKAQGEKAKAENDTATLKKLRSSGAILQAVMHEKGFGTGSVRNEMLAIKDKIDSLAKAEKLDVILSKWELNYSGENVELVDITEKVASLFNPNERFKKMLPGLLKSEPIKDAYLIQD